MEVGYGGPPPRRQCIIDGRAAWAFCPLAASGALCISVEYLRVHSLHTKRPFLAKEQKSSCSVPINSLSNSLIFWTASKIHRAKMHSREVLTKDSQGKELHSGKDRND